MSLLDVIQGISLDPSVGEGVRSSLNGIGANGGVGAPPQTAQIAALAGSLTLPEPSALFGPGAGNLGALVGNGGLPSSEQVFGPLTGGLSQMESVLGEGLRGTIDGAFGSVRSLGATVPEDPGALLSGLAGPLGQAVAVLTESPQLAHVRELVTKIEELRAALAAAPAELASLLGDQLGGAVDHVMSFVTPVIGQVERLLDNLETQLQPAALGARWDALQLQLIPTPDVEPHAVTDPGAPGAALAAALAALDYSSEEAVAEIDAQLRTARQGFEVLAADLEHVATLATPGPFDVNAWSQRLRSVVTQATSVPVNELGSVLQSLQDGLTSAREFVAGLSAEQALQPLRDLSAQLGGLSNGLGLDSVKSALMSEVQSVHDAAEAVRSAQVDLLASVQELASSIAGALDAIDLPNVATTIGNALQPLDDSISQIEQLVDDASSELQSGLDSLRAELETLHASFTEATGSIRQPLEEFLNSIGDAIPDDLPQQLEAAGEAVAGAVSSLDGIAFDPVFDAVIEELHAMRDELRGIDAGSLNPLLEAALTAALAIFEAFDFESEVEQALTEEFDNAVANIAQPAIDELQGVLVGVLEEVRKHDPATLLGELGIEDAYDDLVARLDAFRPSQLLEPVVAQVREAASQLDAFTPSTILKPVVEPLEALRHFLENTLTLDAIFAQLEQALARLTALVHELDIHPFVDSLDATVDGLRAKLESIIDAEGLLDAFRPVFDAASSALDGLDPATLLQPVTDARQTLLDAIDSVDTSALSGALTALAAKVDGASLPALRHRLADRAQALRDEIRAFDVPGRVAQLRAVRQAAHDALEDVGTLSNADAEERRQRLLYDVDGLDPIVVFAGSVTQLRRAQDDLAALVTALAPALADGGPLDAPLQALTARLRELALGVGGGTADTKAALRTAVEQAFDALALDDIQQLYAQVKTTFESFSPDNLEAALNELLAPIHDFLDSIPDPGQLFADVIAAFDDLLSLVDPGLAEFLDTLQTDLQPIVDSVHEKLQILDVSELEQELDEQYAQIIDLRDRLLDRLQQLLDGADAPYREVVSFADELNPGTVLVEPLQETFETVLHKVDGLNVQTVFEPLLEALRGLRDKLVDGIDRTNEAFEEFLGARPGPSQAVSI